MTTREARHLARCALCREQGPPVAERLRLRPIPPLADREVDQLWQGVRAEIEGRPTWRGPAILTTWLRGLGRRRPVLVWTPALAAAILLLLTPLHLDRDRPGLSQAELNAKTVVERVDAGPSTSVLVLETPTERVSVIWVIEPGLPRGE